jgi:predicted MFS family arabinose efflux permease
MTPAQERRLLALLAGVQIINIVDFMMVMPLGPDFASALGIPLSKLGSLGAAYTFSAAIAGVAGASFLDRFDRRPALAMTLGGLGFATLLGAVSQGWTSMILARVLAGAFGGPATTLSLSIVADAVPPARRGQAMGVVMSAFAIASVLGVPTGLWLADQGGWRAPFVVIGVTALLMAALAFAVMPPLRDHLDRAPAASGLPFELLRDPTARLALLANGTVSVGTFALVPNLAAWLQFNVGVPRSELDTLYMIGGVSTFFVTRLGGWIADRLGAVLVAWIGTTTLIAVLLTVFVLDIHGVPALVFMALMGANSLRGVSMNALLSQVPRADERARFGSLQSALQHLGASAGAGLGALFLTEREGRLIGLDRVAIVAATLAIVLPITLTAVRARLGIREDRQGP